MKTLLLFLIGLLVGAAVGYHTRPRIIEYVGGTDDEAVILMMLEECKDRLAQLQQNFNHTAALLDVYKELNEIRKASMSDE